MSVRQTEILEWLRAVKSREPLAELFEGAVIMLEGREPPGWTRFVAHAVREICNRLPDAVLGEKGDRTKYETVIKPLVSRWQVERPSPILDDESPGASAEDTQVLISRDLAGHLDTLVEVHNTSGQFAPARAAKLFADLHGTDAQEHDVGLAARAWRSAADWAVGQCHNQKNTDAEMDVGIALEMFESFERTLGVAVGPIGPMIEDINAVLDETNQRTG